MFYNDPSNIKPSPALLDCQGLVEQLEIFPKGAITVDFLKIAIINKQSDAVKWISERLPHFDKRDFLYSELDKAINNNNVKYIEGLLEFDKGIIYEIDHKCSFIRDALYRCDTECIKKIITHFNIDPNIERDRKYFEGILQRNNRDDILWWWWSTHEAPMSYRDIFIMVLICIIVLVILKLITL